jgi:hypothetical protein
MGDGKVWGESWHVQGAAVCDDEARPVLTTEWRGTGPLDNQDAVARLASAAPDLVRMLLALGQKPCPCCERWNDCDECCALDAALRKAGVR